MVSGQAEFDFAQGMVNRLNAMSDELNLLSERKEYFAGLAENIFQTWTYGSTTHFAGTVSYNWISEEEMASQIVDGWMDSPGHRENILSGFHSQGIGVYATPEGKAYATQNLC